MAEDPSAGKPSSVEAYLEVAPERIRPTLERLRAILHAAAPGSVESLKWRQPALSRQRIVYCFAGYEDHVNFMPTPESLDPFRQEAEAAGLTSTRIVLRIPVDVPFPEELVRRIAEHRAAAEAAGAKYSS